MKVTKDKSNPYFITIETDQREAERIYDGLCLLAETMKAVDGMLSNCLFTSREHTTKLKQVRMMIGALKKMYPLGGE